MNTKMKSNASKKMRGFMCQSGVANGVACMTGDHRSSVIVPRRPDRTTPLLDHHHARLLRKTNYIRLGGSRNINTPPPPPPPPPAAAAAANKMNTSSTLKSSHVTSPSLKKTNFALLLHEDNCHDHKQIRKFTTTQILAPANQVFQVVNMRVSLHCQGCVGKVKRHLSKMEGVSSFSIDLETKRVTVMGHVSPVDVLDSISKVKKAEFWSC